MLARLAFANRRYSRGSMRWAYPIGADLTCPMAVECAGDDPGAGGFNLTEAEALYAEPLQRRSQEPKGCRFSQEGAACFVRMPFGAICRDASAGVACGVSALGSGDLKKARREGCDEADRALLVNKPSLDNGRRDALANLHRSVATERPGP